MFDRRKSGDNWLEYLYWPITENVEDFRGHADEVKSNLYVAKEHDILPNFYRLTLNGERRSIITFNSSYGQNVNTVLFL